MSTKKTTLIIALASSIVLVIIGAIIDYEYRRVLPEGVFLGDLPLSGLNRSQAAVVIDTEINRYAKMQYHLLGREGEKSTLMPRDFGVEYIPSQTLTKVFDDCSWLVKLFNGKESMKKGEIKRYKPVLSIHKNQLRETIQNYFEIFEKTHGNAYLSWNENLWTIAPETPGAAIHEGEIERIIQQVQNQTYSYRSDVTLEAVYDVLPPEFKTADVQELYERVMLAVEEPIRISYQTDTIEIDLKSRHDWIKVNERKKSLSLNEETLLETVNNFAEGYDQEAGEVVVTAVEEKKSEYDGKIYKKAVTEGSFSRGRKSNRNHLKEEIKIRFLDPSLERQLAVEWEPIFAEVTSLVPGYEFPQVISTGISSYRQGNHPNRIKNIELSLESFSGVIIEPGEESSFNRLTGWITPNKGYTKTKIISEGRVKEGVGGGVCQSSTTIYRAILNAGLPIVERRNHTLDVSYYHAYGYGLDATVYTDARSDLRFVNDFPAPVLVNTYTDNNNYEAHVEIYGMTDHRTVELTNIYTGDYLLKKWEWKVVWPDREELRYVTSRYQVPKPEEEEEEKNPLEA
jgi:vancomycin resistance protein YoaR